MVGQEKVAESSRLAMVSEKEGRQEAVASEVAMEVREVAKEVVVMTSLEAGCKKIGLGCKHRQSSFPWVPMVQAILEPSTGGDNLVQEEVMQNDVDGKVAGASVENVSNMAEKEAAKRYVAL